MDSGSYRAHYDPRLESLALENTELLSVVPVTTISTTFVPVTLVSTAHVAYTVDRVVRTTVGRGLTHENEEGVVRFEFEDFDPEPELGVEVASASTPRSASRSE